jgi:hypothetical protein
MVKFLLEQLARRCMARQHEHLIGRHILCSLDLANLPAHLVSVVSLLLKVRPALAPSALLCTLHCKELHQAKETCYTAQSVRKQEQGYTVVFTQCRRPGAGSEAKLVAAQAAVAKSLWRASLLLQLASIDAVAASRAVAGAVAEAAVAVICWCFRCCRSSCSRQLCRRRS